MAPSCFASGDVTAGALIVLVGMVTGDDDSSNTTCFRPGVGARRCVVRHLPVDPVNLPPDGGAGLGGGVGVIGGAGRCTVSTDGRVIGTDKSRKGSRCSAVCPHARQVELVQNPPQNVRRTNVSLGERMGVPAPMSAPPFAYHSLKNTGTKAIKAVFFEMKN